MRRGASNTPRSQPSIGHAARSDSHPYLRARDAVSSPLLPAQTTPAGPLGTQTFGLPTPAYTPAALPAAALPLDNDTIVAYEHKGDEGDGEADTSFESCVSSFSGDIVFPVESSILGNSAAGSALCSPLVTGTEGDENVAPSPPQSSTAQPMAALAASSRAGARESVSTETRDGAANSELGLGDGSTLGDLDYPSSRTSASAGTSASASMSTSTGTSVSANPNVVTSMTPNLSRRAVVSRAPGTLPCALFPHIVDRVIVFSSVDVRLTFRLTSKCMRDLVDKMFVPRHLVFRQTRSLRPSDDPILKVYNWETGLENELFTRLFSWSLLRVAAGLWRDVYTDTHAPDEVPASTELDDSGNDGSSPSSSHRTQGTMHLQQRYPGFLTPDNLDMWNAFVSFTEAIDFESESFRIVNFLCPSLPCLRVLRVGQRDMGRCPTAGPRLRVSKAVVFVQVESRESALPPGPLVQFEAETMVLNLMSFPARKLEARISNWALPQAPRRMVLVLHTSNNKPRDFTHPPQRLWLAKSPYFHHFREVFMFAVRTLRSTSADVAIVGFEQIAPEWFGAPPHLCYEEICVAALHYIRELLPRTRREPFMNRLHPQAPQNQREPLMSRIKFVTMDEYAESIGPREFSLETAPCPPVSEAIVDMD